jgi:metal-dependent hydrolase (beta-lactamase superfamily II)
VFLVHGHDHCCGLTYVIDAAVKCDHPCTTTICLERVPTEAGSKVEKKIACAQTKLVISNSQHVATLMI